MGANLQVHTYAVSVWSGTGTWSQRILFYDESGNIFAIAYFFDAGVTMPAPTGADPATGNMIRLSYRSNRLAAIVDLLRNESPIYVFYDEAGHGGISTHLEKAGEAEL